MLGINQCLTIFDANFLSSRTFPVSGFVGFKMHGLLTSKIISCAFCDLSIPLSLSVYGFYFCARSYMLIDFPKDLRR